MSSFNLVQENIYDVPMDQVSVSPEKLYLSSHPAKAEKFVFTAKCNLLTHGFIRIIFIMSGSGKLVLNGMEFQLRQGAVAILEEGSSLEITPISPTVVYSCSFLPELFGYSNNTYTMEDIKDDPCLRFFFENDIGDRKSVV